MPHLPSINGARGSLGSPVSGREPSISLPCGGKPINSAVTMFEQMTNATGVDIAKLAQGKGNAVELPKELN